jgi:hypothetical protein
MKVVDRVGWSGLVLAFSAVSCLRVPQATVDLSDVTREQVVALRASHEAFVRLYYDRVRTDIDEFLRTKWIPSFLSKAVENKDFRDALDVSYAISVLKADAIRVSVNDEEALPPDVRAALRSAIDTALTTHRARLRIVMRQFADAAEKQIGLKRTSMMNEVDAQERAVLAHLAGAFSDLQEGQSALRAYLASAVKVQREQDVILQKLGLLNDRNKALNAITDASEKAAQGLTALMSPDSLATTFEALLRAARDSTKRRVAGRN